MTTMEEVIALLADGIVKYADLGLGGNAEQKNAALRLARDSAKKILRQLEEGDPE